MGKGSGKDTPTSPSMERSGKSWRLLWIVLAVVVLVQVKPAIADYTKATINVLPLPAGENNPIFEGWDGYYPLTRKQGGNQEEDGLQSQQSADALGFVQAGVFSPEDQSVGIDEDFFRANPHLDRDEVVLHEYGHALMSDLINHEGIGGYWVSRHKTNAMIDITQESDISEVPEILHPIFLAYQETPKDIYQTQFSKPNYYSSCFSEFFAESFAWYVSGQPVSEEINLFFTGIETLHP